MNNRITVKLTAENQEKFSAIEAYAKINGTYFGNNSRLSRNKIVNLIIENFYELFLHVDDSKQNKNYKKQYSKYLRVRDQKMDPNTRKLNHLDLLTTQILYMNFELFRTLVLDQDKINNIQSMFVKDSPEFKMAKLLTNQIVQDRNRNFNLKNKG